MAKWVCNVCGYVYEGDAAPAQCPVCKAPAEKFTKQGDEMVWAAEHVVGIASDVPEDIKEDLRANFTGECSEVGMYLAMSRVAYREGYPEIGEYWKTAAFEEAEHAAKFAELLGEVLTTAPRRTSRCVSRPRTARPPARPTSRSARRPSISTRSMTPSTRWQETRQDTEKHLQAF